MLDWPVMGRPSDLRSALIQAGLDILRDEPLEVLSLRRVGGLVGVSHAAAYRYFNDKNDLLAAIAEQGFHLFYEYQLAGLARQGLLPKTKELTSPQNIEKRIRSLGWTYVHFVIENPGYARIMFAGNGIDFESYPGLVASSTRTFRLLQTAIKDGQQQKLIAPGKTREKTLAAWSMVHGVSMLILDGRIKKRTGLREMERQINSIIEYVFSGMRLVRD